MKRLALVPYKGETICSGCYFLDHPDDCPTQGEFLFTCNGPDDNHVWQYVEVIDESS